MPNREQRVFDPNDIRGLSLAASVSAERRTIVQQDRWAEDDPSFRDFRAMMRGNSGTL